MKTWLKGFIFAIVFVFIILAGIYAKCTYDYHKNDRDIIRNGYWEWEKGIESFRVPLGRDWKCLARKAGPVTQGWELYAYAVFATDQNVEDCIKGYSNLLKNKTHGFKIEMNDTGLKASSNHMYLKIDCFVVESKTHVFLQRKEWFD